MTVKVSSPFRMGLVPMPTAPKPQGPVLPTAQPQRPALPYGPVLPLSVQARLAALQQDPSALQQGPMLPQVLAMQQAQLAALQQTQPQQHPALSFLAQRAQDAFEAAPAAVPDKLPVLQPPPSGEGLPTTKGEAPVNEAEGAQAEAGWESKTSTVEQKTDKDCAEASLTFLNKASRRGEERKSEKDERKEVREKADESKGFQSVKKRTKVNLSDGATPEEVGAVLGSMGIGIKKGIGGFDGEALSGSLKKGRMAMALVDSNAILNPALRPSQRKSEPGKLHWVTIDGYNRGRTKDTKDDLYRVRDSVNGSYWVRAKDLEKAIGQSQEHHGSGGLLLLEKRRKHAKTAEQREELAKGNLDQAAQLGKGTGTGSRRLSLGESS